MGFEVPVSGVDRPRPPGGRLVLAALLVVVAVVAFAIATGSGSPRGREVAAASDRPAAAASPVTALLLVPRAVPPALSCRDIDQATCERMAKAALLALPDDSPEAVEATVWRSLLCNSTFDCPPSYIDGSTPLGSVIVGFADHGPRAAINVVDGGTGRIPHSARAWVVRWIPELD